MARARPRPTDHITCRQCRRDFHAISVLHLRNIPDYDGDHPVQDYKPRFHLDKATCPDARKKIRRSKESFWARRGQHWTRSSLVTEIRRLHRRGQVLRRGTVPARLCLAARRLFGTWTAALAAAGLDYEQASGIMHWTQEKVIQAIRELAERGTPLSATYVEQHHPTLFHAAVKRFPRSWAKALRGAGLDPATCRQQRGRWNSEEAANWVRRQVARKRSLLARAAPKDLLGFVHRRLKTSWVDFVESLGFPYPGVKKCRDWTKERLLAEMRRWYAEGHPMHYKAVQGSYQALIHQARKYFGSWDQARAAMGL